MDEKGLGKQLQAVRRAKGLTQQQLCQRANLSYSTLAKIERGAIKAPSIFTIQRIAEVLGVSLDELVGDVRSNQPGRQLRTTSSGVSFVYFDVNGCLIRGYQRAFTALAADTGALPDVIETLFWRYNDEINRGAMSMSDFNELLGKRLGATVDWSAAYLAAIEPIAEMQHLLKEVAEHFRIGLFTNSMPGLVSAMRSRGLLPDLAYDQIVDSSEIGVVKPDAKAYQIAAERAGTAADAILLVDDDRGNVIGGQEAGWHVLLYDATAPAEALERVRTTLELTTS